MIKNIENLIQKYFGKWNSKNKYKPEYNETIIQIDSAYEKKDIEQLHISLGFQGLTLWK